MLSSVEALRDMATDADAARGHRVGAGGRAPGHGGCITPNSSSAPQPLRKPTTPRLEVGCCPVSRCSATGRPMPMRHAGTVSARVAARQATGGASPATRLQRHSPCASHTTPRLEVGCCPVSRCSATWRPMPMRHAGTVSARVAARQATGGASPATRAQRHSPCASHTTPRLEVGCCPVSRCSATWRPMPMRHAGTVLAQMAARQATGGASPATRAQRHSPCASPPHRGLRLDAVQCRGAPRHGDQCRCGTWAPCRRGCRAPGHGGGGGGGGGGRFPSPNQPSTPSQWRPQRRRPSGTPEET